MGRKSRSDLLLDKSIQAALSAIELYNKPNFLYREESFTILMVNAWELLLKAKILMDNHQDLTALFLIDSSKKKKDGTSYKSPKYKENRSGNNFTIDINGAFSKLNLPNGLKAQLETLIEIRDNAIHFFNESKLFDKKLIEVGTATLKSYVEMLSSWFNRSTSEYNLFLIPIAFDIPTKFDTNVVANESENHKRLLEYIAKQESTYNTKDNSHRISLVVEVKFARNTTGIPIHSTKDGSGTLISIDSEENFKNKYPWSWQDHLLPKLKERYLDFKQDKNFKIILKHLKNNESFVGERFLDWNKKTGTKKTFYSPNILKEFDKHYTKKQ